MHDTGLSEYKNHATAIMKLPLTSEGVLGSQFDKDLRDKKELNKQLSEVLPEISNITSLIRYIQEEEQLYGARAYCQEDTN